MPRVIRNVAFASTSSDAIFRAWVSEMESMLAACGLVRTSDTGQIDPSTVTAPTSGSYSGYSVWRFDDVLQASAAVFLKFQYGAAGTPNRWRTSLQVGKATDGAGNMVSATATNVVETNNTSSPIATTVACYATHSNGFFAISFGMGALGSSFSAYAGWVVQRICDNTGAPTAEGVLVLGPSLNQTRTNLSQVVLLQYLPAIRVAYDSSAKIAFVPWAVADSKVSLSPQLPLHFVSLPKFQPMVGSVGCISGEVSEGQTFSATLVGAVPRTYIGLGGFVGCSAGTTPQTQTAVLWED